MPLGVGDALGSAADINTHTHTHTHTHTDSSQAHILGTLLWHVHCFLWGSLSHEEAAFTLGTIRRCGVLQSPVTCPPWQVASLAAETAVLSGKVPMVTFVHLVGTRPGAVLSRAD